MACERSVTLSLVRTLDRWLRTVFGLSTRRRAIAWLSRPGDELEDVELALGELGERAAGGAAAAAGDRQLGDGLGHVVIEHDVAGGRRPQGVLQALGPGALHEVARRSVAQRGQGGVVILGHRQQDHLDPRASVTIR